jgi:hypothetical protein
MVLNSIKHFNVRPVVALPKYYCDIHRRCWQEWINSRRKFSEHNSAVAWTNKQPASLQSVDFLTNIFVFVPSYLF